RLDTKLARIRSLLYPLVFILMSVFLIESIFILHLDA
ncbi:MAG: hypothetical protein ACI90V_006664, partial [Bacillariaceae sp.]